MAPFLGLKEYHITAIECDGKTEYERRQKMLHQWIKHKGDNATYQNLMQVFMDAEDNDMVDHIREMIGKHHYEIYINYIHYLQVSVTEEYSHLLSAIDHQTAHLVIITVLSKVVKIGCM